MKQASQLLFAATMIAIGVIGLVKGGFAPIWGVVPKTVPDRQLLAYLPTFISFGCGVGLLFRRTAAPAALILLAFLAIWTALFKVPFIIHAPLVEISYQTCGENAVLIAAAWVLYVLFTQRRSFPAGNAGLRLAHMLYGLALIAFGLSHFAYLNMTAPLVPKWLPPTQLFWAYLSGSLYVATGIALVTGILARVGALLAAVQITLITVLVWGPVVLAGPISASDWEESVISWALTAGAWVIAASFGRGGLSVLAFPGFAPKRFARG